MGLLSQFEADMMQIYIRAKKECRYNASRYLRMLLSSGAIATAKALIYKHGGTEGFEKLWEMGRLDLTVEFLILNEKYTELFTNEERKMCRDRLIEYGYKFN